ncbi:MAG: retroviral-like aspartic protease family protein [archaeon]|nr:retroviral-like aspartic protease family protein [archaeon]
MGHIKVEGRIYNIEGTKSKDVVAIVDTGATLTVIPEEIARELGLKERGESGVRTGAGIIKLKRGRAIVEIEGKETVQDVLISDIIDKVLIGAVTLESLALTVDPLTGRLKESELLLY